MYFLTLFLPDGESIRQEISKKYKKVFIKEFKYGGLTEVIRIKINNEFGHNTMSIVDKEKLFGSTEFLTAEEFKKMSKYLIDLIVAKNHMNL